MNKEEKVLRFYLLATSLKNKIRQGSIYWNVSSERRESIAEHIYDTCMLAIALHSEYNIDVDIQKVVTMIAIHELEEVIIGDITPFDHVTAQEKLEKGRIAVEDILSSLDLKDEYLGLTAEFNYAATSEGEFAYLCDKLDFVLQMMLYTDQGYITLEGAKNSPVFKSCNIQNMLVNGATSPKDIFYLFDKGKFENNPELAKLLEYAYHLNLDKFLKNCLNH